MLQRSIVYRNPRRPGGSKFAGIGAKVIIGLIVLAVLAVIGVGCSSYAKPQHVTIHVTGKESVSTSDGNGNSGHEYRVYALEDTYVIKDSWVHPRFNSANLYGKLPVPVGGPGDPSKAKELHCEVYGWRIGILSQFKNILNCDGV